MLAPPHIAPPRREPQTDTDFYVTDGYNLYRRLESCLDRDVLTFEDCRTLEMILLPRDVVRRLRRVYAAA